MGFGGFTIKERMPDPVNKTLKTVDDLINFGAFKVTVPMTQAVIKYYIPCLNWPVLSTVFDYFFTYFFTKYAYTPGIDYTNAVVIKLQTDSQRSAYQNAEGALRAASLSGDQNAINAASTKFDSTAYNLIHFDGFAS